jgi:hypothetical protein
MSESPEYKAGSELEEELTVEEKKAMFAGEKLMMKPQLRDQFGNPSSAPPGAVARHCRRPAPALPPAAGDCPGRPP